MPLGTQGEMSFPTFQLEMENLRPIDLWSCVHTHNDAVRSWCHNPGFPTPYEVALHHAHTSHPQVDYYSTGWWSPPMLDDSTGLIQQPVGEGIENCYVLGTFQLRLLLLTQKYIGNCGPTPRCFLTSFPSLLPPHRGTSMPGQSGSALPIGPEAAN